MLRETFRAWASSRLAGIRAAAEAAVEDPFAQRGVELAGQALGGSRWMPAASKGSTVAMAVSEEESASVDWTCGIDQQWIF